VEGKDAHEAVHGGQHGEVSRQVVTPPAQQQQQSQQRPAVLDKRLTTEVA